MTHWKAQCRQERNCSINAEMDNWLKQTTLKYMPADFGYDTNLWTSAILADLLKQEFDVEVSESTVRLHLKA